MNVILKWITPDAEAMIVHMARVSNPEAKEGDPGYKLIKYLINHKHWSPFEMACVCMEITTTRDIARQILRHRSFHFQEFSQRYAEVGTPHKFFVPRLQDIKNRQNSIECDNEEITDAFMSFQNTVWVTAHERYRHALQLGIAKELARKLLPEGLTPTHMYMQGTVRDWLHYIAIRTGVETQYEHRQIATEALAVLEHSLPVTVLAARQAGLIASHGDLAGGSHGSGGDRH